MQYILINTNNNNKLGLYFSKNTIKQPFYFYVDNNTFTEMYVKADWLSDDLANKKGKNSIFYLHEKYLKEFNKLDALARCASDRST